MFMKHSLRAKDGFNVYVKIVPYLIAMLVGIGVFTASGAMGWLIDGLAWVVSSIGIDTAFVDSLPYRLNETIKRRRSQSNDGRILGQQKQLWLTALPEDYLYSSRIYRNHVLRIGRLFRISWY